LTKRSAISASRNPIGRGLLSTIVTWTPRAWKIVANSLAMTPAPSTTSDLGK
jgi:hypothetical protein